MLVILKKIFLRIYNRENFCSSMIITLSHFNSKKIKFSWFSCLCFCLNIINFGLFNAAWLKVILENWLHLILIPWTKVLTVSPWRHKHLTGANERIHFKEQDFTSSYWFVSSDNQVSSYKYLEKEVNHSWYLTAIFLPYVFFFGRQNLWDSFTVKFAVFIDLYLLKNS